MKNPFSESLREEIRKDFLDSEQTEVFEEFERLNEYFNANETDEFLESDEAERIYFGVLKLANGKISDFHNAIKEAENDWRNILYWSR